MKPVMSLVLVALVAGLVGTSYGGDLSMRRQHGAGMPVLPAHVIRLGDAGDQALAVAIVVAVAVATAVAPVAKAVAKAVGIAIAPAGCGAKDCGPKVEVMEARGADVLFDVVAQR